ncbi:MAG: Phosphoglycolate phosphatase, chromosomal [Tenericutes bacterium ADurb.Bin087]|nr:MAG: Phosphoglycolate phosphatase, chromosomal [Tenericutes bacterium ADurb.Bin087]
MNYKHIIFDLDGTLLDTIPDLLYNLNTTFSELGLPGKFSTAEMATFLGSGKDEQIRRALNARRLSHEKYFAKVNALLSVYYAKNTNTYTEIFPGIKETLAELKARGVKLYVATNKPDHVAKDVVRHYFGDNVFIKVRGDKGDGIIKPNPKFLNAIIKNINDPLETIMFVGDSYVDYMSAKNAGVKCAIVPHGYDQKVLSIKDKGVIFLKKVTDIISLDIN